MPLLYGSASPGEGGGDAGIELARLHREDMVRRSGGGLPPRATGLFTTDLPFERLIFALLIVIGLVFGLG